MDENPFTLQVICADGKVRNMTLQTVDYEAVVNGSVKVKKVYVSGTAYQIERDGAWHFQPNPTGKNARFLAAWPNTPRHYIEVEAMRGLEDRYRQEYAQEGDGLRSVMSEEEYVRGRMKTGY